MEVAHSQRRFVGQQFDTAIASLDAIMGVTQQGPEATPLAEQPPPVVERELAASVGNTDASRAARGSPSVPRRISTKR